MIMYSCYVCSVLCILFHCVMYYCHRVSTQWQLTNISIISYHIVYHITSHHIISYITSHHIASHHIIYHIVSYITSYHIISYHIISYHIISISFALFSFLSLALPLFLHFYPPLPPTYFVFSTFHSS